MNNLLLIVEVWQFIISTTFPDHGSSVCVDGIVFFPCVYNVGSRLYCTALCLDLLGNWENRIPSSFNECMFLSPSLLPPPAHPNHNKTWRDSLAWRNVRPRAHSFCRSHRVYWGRRRGCAGDETPSFKHLKREWKGAIGQKVWPLLLSGLRHVLLWSYIF